MEQQQIQALLTKTMVIRVAIPPRPQSSIDYEHRKGVMRDKYLKLSESKRVAYEMKFEQARINSLIERLAKEDV